MMTPTQLRAWRDAKHWTQEQAATALGYRRRGYQALEEGARPITLTIELAIVGCDSQTKPVRSLRGMTLGDLSDPENASHFRHDVRRATTPGAALNCLQKWGESAIDRIEETAGEDYDAAEDLKRVERELTDLEDKWETLSTAASALVSLLDTDDNHSEALDKAIAAVENAL